MDQRTFPVPHLPPIHPHLGRLELSLHELFELAVDGAQLALPRLPVVQLPPGGGHDGRGGQERVHPPADVETPPAISLPAATADDAAVSVPAAAANADAVPTVDAPVSPNNDAAESPAATHDAVPSAADASAAVPEQHAAIASVQHAAVPPVVPTRLAPTLGTTGPIIDRLLPLCPRLWPAARSTTSSNYCPSSSCSGEEARQLL